MYLETIKLFPFKFTEHEGLDKEVLDLLFFS
jgi:hypothetical protein